MSIAPYVIELAQLYRPPDEPGWEHVAATSDIATLFRLPETEGPRPPSVVVLRLRPDSLGGGDDQWRAQIEAAVAGATMAAHPNVIGTRALRTGRDYVFLIDDPPGTDLARLVSPWPQPVGIAGALAVICQAASGLAHAHASRRAVTHGFVVPPCLHVGEDGVVQVGGFHLPAIYAGMTSAIAGRRRWRFDTLSPEGSRGEAEPRSDVFALGVLALEMITGSSLLVAESDFATVMRARDFEPPVVSQRWPDACPPCLDPLFQGALASKPQHRFRATELQRALHEAARELGFGREPGWEVRETKALLAQRA